MLFPETVWRIHKRDHTVYLTFDDGPIPEVTPWVLDTLDRYGIKATFFMVGENVERHPELLQDLPCQRADRQHAVSSAARPAPLGAVQGVAIALCHHHV